MNLNAGLIISRGRKHLTLRGRDGGITGDKGSRHPTQCLKAKGKRRNIKQEDIFHLTFKHPGLDSGTDSHHLIRVNPLMGLLIEEFLHLLMYQRHPGLPANQDYLINLSDSLAGIS